jgi:hypothetical protein
VRRASGLCVCSAIAILAFARPAAADWHFTPFVGFTLGGNSTFSGSENLQTGRKFFGRKDPVVGGSVSWLGRGLLGVEGVFIYVPGILDPDPDIPRSEQLFIGSHSTGLMGNVLLATPRAWNEHGLRPFVSGGFGVLHLTLDTLLDVLNVRRNVLGYNVGGGAVGFITDRTGVRLDLRRYSYVKSRDLQGVSVDRENLSYWTASVGVVFRY